MNPTKRKSLVFCAILQFLYGFALGISSIVLFFRWVFNDATNTFAPNLFNGILTIFNGNILLTKILTPIIGLFLTVLLTATSNYIMQKPFNKKNNKPRKQFIFILVAFLINLIFTILFALLTFSEPTFFCVTLLVLTGLVAILELIAMFLPNGNMLGIEKKEEISSPDSNQTATQSLANDTQKEIQFITTSDYDARSAELFRLAKNKRISDKDLVACLHDLMTLPVDNSYDYKIKHLSKFSTHGMLTQNEISMLVCAAILSYNTSNVKKRIRYIDFLRSKGLINELDYTNTIRKLMTIKE